jgi:hypothetical protein
MMLASFADICKTKLSHTSPSNRTCTKVSTSQLVRTHILYSWSFTWLRVTIGLYAWLGTTFIPNVYGIFHDPAMFSEPDKFMLKGLVTGGQRGIGEVNERGTTM